MRLTRIVVQTVVLGLLLLCALTVETEMNDASNTHEQADVVVNRGTAQDYNADVSKILGILINNLYTNRSIFMREVISNASDALDKIRFLYLTDSKSPKNKDGDEPTMDVRIRIDRERKTLVIRDGGVGMTPDELRRNLGMLGASGTKAFLEKMSDAAKDANLIGQFGVGFYSVFLVADTVQVSSKHDSESQQWMWESSGDGTFYLYEDPRGDTLGRGTELTLHLKEDAEEFLKVSTIKETIRRYSEFIHFPIYIEIVETKRVPKAKEEDTVGDAETEPVDESSEKGEEDVSVDGADDEETDENAAAEKGKAEVEYEEVEEQRWERVNENEPIWTRKATTVTEDEHNKFYRSMTRDYDSPLYYSHFKAEGDVDFTSILYVPSHVSSDAFSSNAAEKSVRLYVRRVFITDEFKDLLPRYLSFIQGVVDSDDLPLNVSRELLQENRVLKIIKKKLLRKVLSMFSDIAQQDQKLKEKQEKEKKAVDGEETDSEDGAEKEEEVDADTNKEDENDTNKTSKGNKVLNERTYGKFWDTFGTHLRLGVIEDHSNRSKLMKLLRYKTSKKEDVWCSLDEYIERMPSTQKGLYFVTGESIEQIKSLPVVEDALKRDVEVLFMTDPIDEYVVSHVTEYSGKKFVNLSKEGAKLGTTTARDRKIDAKRKEKYDALLQWYKKLLGDKVTKVTLTQRMTSEPVLITSSQHGVTAMMSQILKHQSLTDRSSGSQQKVQKILEINHLHPLIQELYKRVTVDEDDEQARSAAQLLFSTASLRSGFEVDDVKEYASYVDTMIRSGLEVSPTAEMIEEDVSEYEIETNDDDDDEEEEQEGADEVDMSQFDMSGATSIPLDFNMATESVDENGSRTMSFDLSGNKGESQDSENVDETAGTGAFETDEEAHDDL